MIRAATCWTALGLGSAGVAVTLLPLLPSDESFIRVWDYPRVQVAMLLAAVLLATPWVLRPFTRGRMFFAAAVAGALAWQVARILPYTPVHPVEAKQGGECDDASRLSLLVANVLVTNREAGPLLAQVEALQPDLVLLVESGEWWDRALEPLRAAYPHEIGQPQDDGYGMHLFSRFELVGPEVRFLLQNYVPSIRTGLRLRSGATIMLYGVHPRPPPLEDTERRDAELMLVGREVEGDPTPAIVAGDLNDVAWLKTTTLFQDVSGLLDPRVGRGPYPTFNANWPLLRWPIDHVFFEASFRLLDLAVLPHIGSDHFPFLVSLCHAPEAAAEQQRPEPEPEDAAKAEEKIEEGRETDQRGGQ